jgi:hypothetical protein
VSVSRPWAALAVASSAILLPPRTRAQVCDGYASLRDRHFLVAASFASYSYAKSLEGSFAAGGVLYASAAAGWTHDAELDASTADLRAAVGADLAVGLTRRVFLCPAASVSVSLGPYNFLAEQQDYRYVDRAIRMGLAAIPIRTGHLALIAFGGLSLSRLTVIYWPTGLSRALDAEGGGGTGTYWLASGGVAVLLDDVLALRPTITVPFGLRPAGLNDFVVPFGRENNEVSLGISIGVSFGRRRSTSRAADPRR